MELFFAIAGGIVGVILGNRAIGLVDNELCLFGLAGAVVGGFGCLVIRELVWIFRK